jgi:hypothetical protein
MGAMLAPLPLQYAKGDIVEGKAEGVTVLRIAMLDRSHASGHVDTVPCQTENVPLAQARRKSEHHDLALMSR